MTVRKVMKELHLWLSLPLGIIISIICFSGAILVFEQEIVKSLNSHLYKVERQEGAMALPPSRLLEIVGQQIPDSLQLSSIQYFQDPEAACVIGFRNAGRKTLSVNPYNGQVNGWIEQSSFFQTVKKLHRWVMDAPAAKGKGSIGKYVVGFSTLFMVVILISGLVLWMPRTMRSLKNRLCVAYNKGVRRFWYDVHVSLGFYATLFLLVMALTGLTWSFSWWRSMAYNLIGGKETAVAIKEEVPHKKSENKKRTFDFTAWDVLLPALQQAYPAYHYIQLDTRAAYVAKNTPGSMRKLDQVDYDKRSGAIESTSRFEDKPLRQKLKGYFYAFHTGSWGGWITKVIYFIACLIGGTLPLTGYYLWWKRIRR